MQRFFVGGVCAGFVLVLSGCPNPNMYTTPRTLDPGRVEWQVAPEVIGVNYNVKTAGTDANGNPTTVQTNVSGVLPMVPSFGARIGVAEGLDVGVRLQNLDSLAADLKIRLLKGRFDIAVDPGIQGFYASANSTSFGVFYLHAPVLLGLNFSDRFTLVVSPGFVYSVTTATVNDGSGVQGASTASGPMGRLGVGFDFRITEKFAIHPELTFMQEFGNENLLLWVAGVGFNIGAQPDYSDLAQPAPVAPPAPTGAPPPPATQQSL